MERKQAEPHNRTAEEKIAPANYRNLSHICQHPSTYPIVVQTWVEVLLRDPPQPGKSRSSTSASWNERFQRLRLRNFRCKGLAKHFFRGSLSQRVQVANLRTLVPKTISSWLLGPESLDVGYLGASGHVNYGVMWLQMSWLQIGWASDGTGFPEGIGIKVRFRAYRISDA